MKCPSKKELTLLYYNELDAGKEELIRSHIRSCAVCKALYAEVAALQAKVTAEGFSLSSPEIEQILAGVKEKVHAPGIFELLREKIRTLITQARLRVYYWPQLIPVALALIIALSIFPVRKYQRAALQAEFDILEIEMELSLEDADSSIFDLYEGDAVFLNETSRRRVPTALS